MRLLRKSRFIDDNPPLCCNGVKLRINKDIFYTMTCAPQITTIIENFHIARNSDTADIILHDLEVGVN